MAEWQTDRLAEAFCDCVLAHDQWTHHAHLRVGLWHLMHYSAEEAMERLRERIRRYNVACGVANTEHSGYHETITRFYVWIIVEFLNRASGEESIDELAEVLVADYGDKNLPLRYYSRERLMSSAARLGWVEPDLVPMETSVPLS